MVEVEEVEAGVEQVLLWWQPLLLLLVVVGLVGGGGWSPFVEPGGARQ